MLFILKCCSSEKDTGLTIMTSLIQICQNSTKLSQVRHRHILTALRNVKVILNTTAQLTWGLLMASNVANDGSQDISLQPLSLSKSTTFEFISWLLVIPQITVEVSIVSFILRRKMNCGHSLFVLGFVWFRGGGYVG